MSEGSVWFDTEDARDFNWILCLIERRERKGFNFEGWDILKMNLL